MTTTMLAVYSIRVSSARLQRCIGQEMRASAKGYPTRDQVLRREHGGIIVWAACFFLQPKGSRHHAVANQKNGVYTRRIYIVGVGTWELRGFSVLETVRRSG